MRTILLLLAALALRAQAPAPVIVELFTSEGCSSCPPADEVLRRLEAQPVPGARIIALGLHVDYWDNLGWRDRFSSAEFTRRQEGYARAFGQNSIYTPEMVVDGQKGFVGSAEGTAVDAVKEAARRTKLPITLSLKQETLVIHFPSALPAHAAVSLAITEDDLASDVSRGENGGRRLHHAAVVRQLARLGAPQADMEIPLAFASSWNRDHMQAVVFLQSEADLKILGAAAIALR